MLDPNPSIQGKGMYKLDEAGVRVQLAEQLVSEIKELNKDFITAQEMVQNQEFPRVELILETPTVSGMTAGVPTRWRMKFTFSNRGNKIVRVSNSSISLSVEGPGGNIAPQHHGFGPGDSNDFFVKPGDPIMSQTDVGIWPKDPTTNWDKEYAVALTKRQMAIAMVIHYEDSDELLKFKKSHDLTVPIISPAESPDSTPVSSPTVGQVSTLPIHVELPSARYGDKSTVKIDFPLDKTVFDLIRTIVRENTLPATSIWYLNTGSHILGPESYNTTIQASGVQSGQIVTLTDKPLDPVGNEFNCPKCGGKTISLLPTGGRRNWSCTQCKATGYRD